MLAKGGLSLLWLLTLMVALGILGGYLWYRFLRRWRVPAKPLPAASAAEAEYRLPTSYGQDEIVLMVKDPHWLYAYWDLAPTTASAFEQSFGLNSWNYSQPVLRLYDLTGNPNLNFEQAPYQDIAISDTANNWYIFVGQPRHVFGIDLGRLLPQGQFVRLIRSNVVTTPSDSVSSEIDPNWPPLGAIWEPILIQAGIPKPTGGISSPEVQRRRISSEELMRR